MGVSIGLKDDKIAALATPLGESALAVIRTSGSGCIETLSRAFSNASKLESAVGNSMVYGWLSDGGLLVDEVTLAVYREPKSYSGEDSVEIFCHGNIPGIEKIFRLLFRLGFRRAEPGEFTLRGFINGKMDLTRAEAVHDLVVSKSAAAQSLALNRLSGRLFEEIDRVKTLVVKLSAAVLVQLDYPDDELPDESDDSLFIAGLVPLEVLDDASTSLDRLCGSYKSGRLYREGARIALAGRTNAGKSSLFNLFLKEDRSIVSEAHGTTRDFIEAPAHLNGIPLQLFDTAGLRDVEELVEKEGIKRSGEIIENSGIVLYLVDGTDRSIEAKDFDNKQFLRIDELEVSCVKIWTKVDLPQCAEPPTEFLPLSVLTGEGFDELQGRIGEILGSGQEMVTQDAVIIDSLRQKHLLGEARQSLARVRSSLTEGYPLDVIAMGLQACLRTLEKLPEK